MILPAIAGAAEAADKESPAGAIEATTAAAAAAFEGALRSQAEGTMLQALGSLRPAALDAPARAELPPDAKLPAKEKLAVRFSEIAAAEGTLIVAAQVVGHELMQLASPQASAASLAKPTARAFGPADLIVELRGSAEARGGHACVRVPYGPFGPVRLDLELCDGSLELRAQVSNARALAALRGSENALRAGLTRAGFALRSLEIALPRKGAAIRGRSSGKRFSRRQEES